MIFLGGINYTIISAFTEQRFSETIFHVTDYLDKNFWTQTYKFDAEKMIFDRLGPNFVIVFPLFGRINYAKNF